MLGKGKKGRIDIEYEPLEPESRIRKGYVELDGRKHYVGRRNEGRDFSLLVVIDHETDEAALVEGEARGKGTGTTWARYVYIKKPGK
ncbi:MAG: hypothetical protein GTN38_01150 [Candidatus Aenigmarchaeota archaeon]|nr:hypothetical protein [Candidatus Aenigmarchaeota archaeon]NIP40236.1 hypothetical protein [Candidatus Aenigmarchaeota archaeon]NIQ17501.1 hypothetical protein [Candidatus Aenigmarchaeota archaeon]